jgi:putative methyltransferase
VPDVLGLSCYTWNWELQCEIALRIKKRNPRCLVVAGGPHPDYKDPGFFKKYPFIDMVAVKDGEITFSKILTKVLTGDHDYSGIGGLHLPDATREGSFCTGPAELPVAFDHSPYIGQSAYFEKLSRLHGPSRFDVIWETNRGCPYSCSFCDWGSNTMSKVRRFDMERVEAEIDWFARMKVKSILLADANFGMLPRDLEIADLLNAARAKHGYPRFVHYSPAKNNPERTVAIAKKFFASGISPVHTFAVQHTDVGVLAAADRANISVRKQRDVAKAVVAHNIPTLVQLIIGIPGDTYEAWKTCLTDLMDWGLHDNYQIFNYALLPNAPAADKEYIARWEIETVSRDIPKEGTGQRKADDTDALTRVSIITKSQSFSRDEWVKMKAYAAFVRALHNFGLSRLVAMYLHFGHGVSYREFYDALIEDHFGASVLYRRVIEHFRSFLANENAMEDLELEQFPEASLYLESSRWLLLQLCLDFERCFDGIEAFLLERYPHASNLNSAIAYQRNVVVLPADGGTAPKSFRTDHDWIGYFEKARLLTSHEPLGEPQPSPGAVVTVEDQVPSSGPAPKDERGRWLAWIENTKEVRRTLNSSFQQLRLQEKWSQR